MGTRSLELFFQPKSIAVIGASERPGNLGGAIVRNLLNGEFPGLIIPVNSRGYKEVYGIPALSRIGQIEDPVDLAHPPRSSQSGVVAGRSDPTLHARRTPR